MLVPSAYLLMVQSAYRPPAYSALMLLFPVCLWLADQARRSAQPALWLLATGVCSGFAFSGHMLALPYVAASLLLAVAVPDRRQLVPRIALVAVSFGVGLAPYLLALLRMPGAHEAVAIPITFREVLARLAGVAVGSQTCPFGEHESDRLEGLRARLRQPESNGASSRRPTTGQFFKRRC